MSIPVTRVPNVRKMQCSGGQMVKRQILFKAPSTEHLHRPERVGAVCKGRFPCRHKPGVTAMATALKVTMAMVTNWAKILQYVLVTHYWKVFTHPSYFVLRCGIFFSDQHVHNDNSTVLIKFKQIFLLQKTVQSHFHFSSASHCLSFRSSPLQYHRRHHHRHL